MSVKKLFGGIVALLVVVVIAAVFVVAANLNDIIKTAVEKLGPDITGTTIVLDKVDLAPLSGRGELIGFVVGNPKGFTSDYAFKLDKIVLDVNIQSILKGGTIVIEEMTIDGAGVSLDINTKGKNNLEKIADNAGAGTDQPSSTPTEAPDGEEAVNTDIKIALKEFNFVNAVVNLAVVTDYYQNTPKEIILPNVQLTDIGTEDEGVTPEQAVKVITDAVYQQVLSSAGDLGILLDQAALKAEMKKRINAEMADAKAKANEKIEEEKEEATKKMSEKINDKLGDLFN